MAIDKNELRMFTGTNAYYRYSPLFRNILLTDGSKYLAENANAFWLMDVIASHQPNALKDKDLDYFQLWTLKVNKDHSAVITCQKDSGAKPSITQNIEYTDFELDEVQLYCQRYDEKNRVIFLTSEY